MTAWADAAGLLCTILGLVCAAAVLARTRDLPQALRVLLDFLLAAGLLRSTHDMAWRALATTAAVVVLRTVLTLALIPGARP